jgi:hypothetical protein
MRIVGLALLSSLLLALTGGTAAAQDPTVRGYDESLGVIGEIDTADPQASEPRGSAPSAAPAQAPAPGAAPVAEQGSALPFTGLDLGIIAALGALLLGTGFVLRRTTRGRTTT